MAGEPAKPTAVAPPDDRSGSSNISQPDVKASHRGARGNAHPIPAARRAGLRTTTCMYVVDELTAHILNNAVSLLHGMMAISPGKGRELLLYIVGRSHL